VCPRCSRRACSEASCWLAPLPPLPTLPSLPTLPPLFPSHRCIEPVTPGVSSPSESSPEAWTVVRRRRPARPRPSGGSSCVVKQRVHGGFWRQNRSRCLADSALGCKRRKQNPSKRAYKAAKARRWRSRLVAQGLVEGDCDSAFSEFRRSDCTRPSSTGLSRCSRAAAA